MPEFMSLPVLNTFVHFSDEDEESFPMRAIKSDPVHSILAHRDVRRRATLRDLGADLLDGDGGEPSHRIQLKLDRALSDESTGTDVSSACASDADEDSEADVVSRDCTTGPAASAPRMEPADAAVHPVPLPWPMALPILPVLVGPSGSRPLPRVHNAAPTGGEPSCASWTVHAAEIESTNNKICLGQFFVALPGFGSCPFQIILYAEDRLSKGPSGGFRGSRGRGRVEVRCQAQLPPNAGQLDVDVAIGSGRRALPTRGPVAHDFSRQACCGWRRLDFQAAVDPMTGTFIVCASFALGECQAL